MEEKSITNTQELSKLTINFDEHPEAFVVIELWKIYMTSNEKFRSNKSIVNEIQNWLNENKLQGTKVYYAVYRKVNIYKLYSLLGFILKNGIGIKADENRAFYWYKRAADEIDNPFAQSRVGNFYQFGEGTEVNYESAFSYYQKSASHGNAIGIYYLGLCHEKGCGTNPNSKQAFELYKLSASVGFPEAQYMLATCYYRGYGTRISLQKAFFWYFLAAEDGDNDRAKFAIGYCFRNGFGLVKDIHASLKFFRRTDGAPEVSSEAFIHFDRIFRYRHG
ncbi:5848_t:CDS:2 [Ambispora leptoticha]|uniref:5848_t:CDS:1 n=1 Tax=Ambispora leptoticha TaxID=144679 RepID=A0A9N9AUD0_9GLOM|nr:5848_t:CDS:2 [Ambispora leptoticha]